MKNNSLICFAMKKSLKLLVLSMVVFTFAACKGEAPAVVPDKVEKQTQDLEDLKAKVKELEDKNASAEEEGVKEEEEVKKEEPVEDKVEPVKEKVESVKKEEPVKEAFKGENSLSLTSPAENAGISKEPITFSGKVSPNTTKIVVKQSYPTDKGETYVVGDTYTLKDFKEGDEKFTYRAATSFGNLKLGSNKFDITAYFSDGSKKTVSRKISFWGGENSISIANPSNGAIVGNEPVDFVGFVSPNTTKIVVTASGGVKGCAEGLVDGICFPYYSDVYTLKDFKNGDFEFIYRAAQKWGNLTHGENKYSFKATFDDGSTKVTSTVVYFQPEGAGIGKPVIYLYPEETTDVYVDVKPNGGISISDPELGDGWHVKATPDSRIYNYADGKNYPYLFWEGYAVDFETPEDGFVVASKDVDAFFNRKLSVLGMNAKEIADFKEYWVPKLSEKPYYFITFVDQETFNGYAPLTIDPQPDSLIRVFFDYKGLDRPVRVRAQHFETPARDGFTVVEWGGRLY